MLAWKIFWRGCHMKHVISSFYFARNGGVVTNLRNTECSHLNSKAHLLNTYTVEMLPMKMGDVGLVR